MHSPPSQCPDITGEARIGKLSIKADRRAPSIHMEKGYLNCMDGTSNHLDGLELGPSLRMQCNERSRHHEHHPMNSPHGKVRYGIIKGQMYIRVLCDQCIY